MEGLGKIPDVDLIHLMHTDAHTGMYTECTMHHSCLLRVLLNIVVIYLLY